MLLSLLPLLFHPHTNSVKSSFFHLALSLHLPHLLSPVTLSVFTHLFSPCSPFMPHTLIPCLFLNHMSFSLPLLSILHPSVLPLGGEMNWCVSWVDHPSSCCLPTATLFPSCVAVFLCLFPSASACHSLRPSTLCRLSLYHVGSSLFLSHCFHPMPTPNVTFIPPWDRSVRKIQPHVHKQSDVALHVYVPLFCTLFWVPICTCVRWSGKERLRESTFVSYT